jgi:hypothetical protein
MLPWQVLALVDHLGDGIARRAQVLLPDASDIHRMMKPGWWLFMFYVFYKRHG